MADLEDAVAAAGRSELVSFHVGSQAFCVDIMGVREIRGWAPATPLPHSPAYVNGVINLRGAVLPVVDLAARLDLGVTEPTARSVIIVARICGRLVGLLVDAVSDILTITDDMIQPTPDVACASVDAFVTGVLALDGRMISLISLDRILPASASAAA